MSSLQLIHPRSLKHLSGRLRGLVRARLWLQVIVGMMLGIGLGQLLGPGVGWVSPETATLIGNWLALPGQLFLTILQMIVVPLVFASVIRGIAASEDLDQLKKLGLRLVLFFLATTTLAAVIGIGIALWIQPGTYIDGEGIKAALGEAASVAPATPADVPRWDELPARLVSLLPNNPLASMVQREMLQVVLFSVVIGLALLAMVPNQAKPLLELLGSLQAVCITIVRGAVMLAPVAVFGLMTQLSSRMGASALLGMGVYIATVLAGLLTMMVVYLLLVAIVGKKNPIAFLAPTKDVLLLAFSTSSSAAVMPLSIKTADEKLGVRPSISQFVIPFGATVNMAGTAVYQGTATIFLAQLFGVDLSLGALSVIVVTAVASSVGAPATPGVGIVILATLLKSVGVPISGIALIMGVDRILDMCRTSVNVAGDLVACTLMERWIGGEKSAAEALAEEGDRELLRKESGEDVIIMLAPESTER